MDNNSRPPTVTPVSDENSSVDYLLGHPHTKSEEYFVFGYANDSPYNYPSPDSKIPSPTQPSTPNNYQEGYISREGSQAEPKKNTSANNGLKQFGNEATMEK